MVDPLVVLAVFVTSIIDDVTWCQWTLNVNKHKPAVAAFWAVCIGAIGSVSVIAFVSQPLYLIPMCAGLWVGTFFTTRRARDQERISDAKDTH